ncbi:hypothetical protein F5887DRAFT_924936 [Amanita rubescens]|nr:hypothetical protein F5887DRAFT_924936 [Amanita rubescens]
MPHAPPRPFHASVDDTVVITYIDITSPLSSSASAFTLFIHCRTLLETVSNLTCADEPVPLDIRHQSNTADVRDGPDSGVPCSFSALTTYSHAPAGWRNLQEGMYDVRSIPWSKWGPSISRWFNIDQMEIGWTATSVGQRWAVLDRVSDGNCRIRIVDFNPYNIIMTKGRHDNIFAEDIKMGIGCTIYTAPEMYDFTGLLMEEEGLLGLKVNDEGSVEKITVFHFG